MTTIDLFLRIRKKRSFRKNGVSAKANARVSGRYAGAKKGAIIAEIRPESIN
jgi:hypothetical protein